MCRSDCDKRCPRYHRIGANINDVPPCQRKIGGPTNEAALVIRLLRQENCGSGIPGFSIYADTDGKGPFSLSTCSECRNMIDPVFRHPEVPWRVTGNRPRGGTVCIVELNDSPHGTRRARASSIGGGVKSLTIPVGHFADGSRHVV